MGKGGGAVRRGWGTLEGSEGWENEGFCCLKWLTVNDEMGRVCAFGV